MSGGPWGLEGRRVDRIPDDPSCLECGASPELRVCQTCGTSAHITDCGHFPQPRPIAAGHNDGSDLFNVYCYVCA
jgi:hypothetical protein